MNLSKMHTVRSYEDCVRIFDALCDGKKRLHWGDREKPLDSWAKPHVKMYRSQLYFDLRLYHTDLVTYEQSGNVHIVFDRRQGSQQFLHHTLPAGVTWVKNGKDYLWQIQAADGFIYLPVGSGRITLTPAVKDRPGVWCPIGSFSRSRLEINWPRVRKIDQRLVEINDFIRAFQVVRPPNKPTFVPSAAPFDRYSELKGAAFDHKRRHELAAFNHNKIRTVAMFAEGAAVIKPIPLTEPPKACSDKAAQVIDGFTSDFT